MSDVDLRGLSPEAAALWRSANIAACRLARAGETDWMKPMRDAIEELAGKGSISDTVVEIMRNMFGRVEESVEEST